MQLFLKNPRFVGLKFPDMSRPETLQKRFVGKVRKMSKYRCKKKYDKPVCTSCLPGAIGTVSLEAFVCVGLG